MADVEIINDLSERLHDSIAGYKKAAEISNRSDFKSLFMQRADARLAWAEKFKARVEELGGAPKTEPSVAGRAHTLFLDIGAAFQDDDAASINAVRKAEEKLAERFAKALDESDLAPHSRMLVQSALTEIRADAQNAASIDAAGR